MNLTISMYISSINCGLTITFFPFITIFTPSSLHHDRLALSFSPRWLSFSLKFASPCPSFTLFLSYMAVFVPSLSPS